MNCFRAQIRWKPPQNLDMCDMLVTKTGNSKDNMKTVMS